MKIEKTVGRQTVKKQKPIKLVLDIDTLDILCRYILSSSSMIRTTQLVNLRNMINILDTSTYINDPEKKKRIDFIEKGIEARVEDRLTDRSMILAQISRALGQDIDFIDLSNVELNKDELEWVDGLISETLKYQFIYDKIDDVQDVCTRFSATDYAHRGEIVDEFEDIIDDLKNDFRRVNAEDSGTDMTFSLREGVFERAITDTYNLVTNPSRRLISGMIGLNEMVGGGFESGRVYALFGLGGIGKSLTLLNLMLQFKKYNRYYKTKDPTKTPCVVLLTMENTVVETITRLFAMVDPNGYAMTNYSNVNDVIRILRTNGELAVTPESPIDIVIKYKPNKSVDTSYLYTLCEDLEDDGYEVICMIQDHIKRIRSAYGTDDLRIELGDVVNEMKVFAAEKDIPFITVSHLNRDAAKQIERRSNSAGSDVTRKLGKSNVGESLLMIDNLDCGIVVNLEFDNDGNRYMCFNLIKMRDKVDLEYFAQPFAYGSTIRLVEDQGSVPMFKLSLKDDARRPKVAQKTTNPENSLNAIVNDMRPGDNAFDDNGPMSLEPPKRRTICPLIFFDKGDGTDHSNIGNMDIYKSMVEKSKERQISESSSLIKDPDKYKDEEGNKDDDYYKEDDGE